MKVIEIHIGHPQTLERQVDRFLHIFCRSIYTTRFVTNDTELSSKEDLVTFTSPFEPVKEFNYKA